MSSGTRLTEVHERIRLAASAAGRSAQDITLVAVSKTFAAEAIVPVLDAGHRIFGENRVQEAQAKWPALKAQYNDAALHLIGPLQSNKVKDAVALFDVIETLDRPKLAARLARECAAQNRWPQFLVQVNTGEEPQKAGVIPAELPDFLAFCRAECDLSIAGLMAIPPVDEAPALHFALLRKLAAAHDLPLLSMGMSADFETAIAFGATHIRVGTAIFGKR